jgi:uncharacterized protein YegJ (DUF2314 family)
VTRGTLKRSHVETTYGVIVPAGADVGALEKLVRDRNPSFELERTSFADLFTATQLQFVTKDMSKADVDRLKASSAVIAVSSAGNDGIKLTRELAGVTREVADAAHGWVFDPETAQIFTASEFHDHVPGDHLDVRKLIVVHSVLGANEQPFLDTAGLRRYGLPELYFPEAATGQINQITHLMNAAAQMLLDGGDVNERGEIAVDFHKLGWNVDIIEAGTGKAVWKTRWARERDAGEHDELVVELVPPTGNGPEGAAKLIDDCFGFKPDEIVNLKANDPDLLAAAEKARADLAKLRPHFAKEIPYDERLTVKAKFTDSEDHVEWMWVDVVAFKGNTLEGTLANDPDVITSLRNGQKVKVKLADVGDYLYEKRGGESAGGYSIEVMKKRGLLPADGP